LSNHFGPLFQWIFLAEAIGLRQAAPLHLP
jgi:hypothetical protein